MSTQNSTWDKGLDYEKTYDRLRKEIISKDKEFQKLKKPEKMIKVSILLIACRNGARLTESINAYNEFIKTHKREISILVEKRKKTNPYNRLIIIPGEIPETLSIYSKTKEDITMFCKRHFGYNPHSLRYSFINKLNKQGVAPQIIAKITGHAQLKMILDYTQDQIAQDILKNLR